MQELDHIEEEEIKKKRRKKMLLRLNILFLFIFILFSALILRLGVVQIVKGEEYKKKLEKTEAIIVSNPVPRGKIFDRSGKLVVGNVPKEAITFTQFKGEKAEDMIKVAEKLAKIIDKDIDKITERDKKDFWIARNPDLAQEKVTKEELKDDELSTTDLYRLQLDRISEEDLASLTDEDLKVLAIYREFSGYALTPQIVKNEDVTAEEFAIVSENLADLPGVNTSIDWDREYLYEDTIRTILGKVSSSNEGLPSELLEYYLAKGYSRNDRVGKSYLEYEYEDVLSGQKSKTKNVVKENDLLETELVYEGERGRDLVLTIDMDLQLAVEKIIEEELETAKKTARTNLLDRAFVVLLDPYSGDVLTMAGKQYIKNEKTNKMEMRDFALGNMTTSYEAGSVVKGATVFTGYKTGVNYPGKIYHDSPIRIRSSAPKSSWRNMGNVNDITALEQSSNVYMFKTAIEIGEGNYRPGQALPINPAGFDRMRDSFGEFGLGVRTGIDLPNEAIGYKGSSTLPGFLLDLSIGQYDTYTPLQLAQYVATVANGGYRIQPHIVKEIRQPSNDDELGPIVETVGPTVLNRLDIRDQRWIDNVRTGFHRVMQGNSGTASSVGQGFKGRPYDPAGKTGTAESFYDGPIKEYANVPVMNLSLVGFAPYDKPQVAMAVMVPWAYEGRSGHTANLKIGNRVLESYFELQKKKNQDEDKEEDSNRKEDQETNESE